MLVTSAHIQGKIIRFRELKFENNKKFLGLHFGPANTTHKSEIKIEIIKKLDNALINLKLFVGSSLLPLVDHTLSFCRLEREMNRNIITKVYLSQNPIFMRTYETLKKCPVQSGMYIIRNMTEVEEEVDEKFNLPGLNYPQVTIKALVTARIVQLRRRETLIATMLVLDVIDDDV